MPYANHRRCVKIVACSLNGLFWVTGTLFVGVAAWSVATGSQVSLVDQLTVGGIQLLKMFLGCHVHTVPSYNTKGWGNESS
ncbi:uncharacterized protein LOC134185017 isoform X2 [Corticium candelabrum]|uniref:uncharacterized protein LOC134185017 isoform X2 n=1 Tax=Corticium candelabrum TaxID=121492 RepID=UPI002E34650C|nr:uncharacterized protein LOC134185017 isoform X2 [Corticium candelabrum]